MTYTPLIEEIATYLQATLVPATYGTQGLVSGVNMFLARYPAEAPDAAVVIQQYQGKAPTFTMGAGGNSAIEYPKVQIEVRGLREDYPTAYAWSRLIRNTLTGVILPNPTYFPNVLRIESLGIPNPIGYDEIQRPKFTMNFTFTLNVGSDGLPMP